MRSKLTKQSETSKPMMETTVHNHSITPNGVMVSFTYQGKYGNFSCNPSQTAQLLEGAGLIKEAIIIDGTPLIYTEALDDSPDPVTGEHNQEPLLLEETWKEFVERYYFEMTDSDAVKIVNRFIQQQELTSWETEMRDRLMEIPTIIRHFLPSA